MTMSEGSFVTGATESSIIESAVKDLLYTKHSVLARGKCGVVLDGTWEGRRAAIKLWNGEDNDELNSLRREIRVYRLIQDNNPSIILDSAVPRLLLGWNKKNGDVVLITEYVGQEVGMDADGNILVGGNVLSEEDIHSLRNAAQKSISEIHSCGVLHGDLALRNLRAQKVQEHGTSSWKAWWLDLGRSETGVPPGSTKSSMEKRECRALFSVTRLG